MKFLWILILLILSILCLFISFLFCYFSPVSFPLVLSPGKGEEERGQRPQYLSFYLAQSSPPSVDPDLWVWGTQAHFWGSDPERGSTAAPFSNPGILKFGKPSKVLKSDPFCPSLYTLVAGESPFLLTHSNQPQAVCRLKGTRFRVRFHFLCCFSPLSRCRRGSSCR